jgi:hypothetical protein
MTEISNNDKIISISDITARVDELREERDTYDAEMPLRPVIWAQENPDDAEELANLEKLLEAIEGHGSGWEWEGKRYPDLLIAEYHFEEFAEDTAHDMGAVSRDASWIVIDWTATANGLKQDYREVDFDGSAYWHRV